MRRAFDSFLHYLLLISLTLLATKALSQQNLRFGVVANRPATIIQQQLKPLAEYLSTQIDGRNVDLIVLNQTELEDALSSNSLDLLLIDPAEMLTVRSNSHLTNVVASLITTDGKIELNSLGGTIVALKSRDDINKLSDLENKNISVVSTSSLAGFLSQSYEFLEAGLDYPTKKNLSYQPDYDHVLQEVLAGKVDAGFLPTGILESFQSENKLDITKFKVINAQNLAGFPYLISTRLYPEFALLTFPTLDRQTKRAITFALLTLRKDHPELKGTNIAGFSPAADYSSVDQLAQKMRAPPYDVPIQISIQDIWQQYRSIIVVSLVAFTTIVLLLVLLIFRNRELKQLSIRISESEVRFRSLFENLSSIAVQGYDNNRLVFFWNRASESLYGYSKEEAIGKHYDDLVIPSEMKDAFIHSTDKWLSGGVQIEASEGVHKRKDGYALPVYTSYSKQIGFNGSEIYCFSIDLTEQKRTKRRLELALDATKILIWEVDFTTGILGYERNEMTHLGLDPLNAPITLNEWLARVHVDDQPGFNEQLMQTLNPDSGGSFEYEYRFQNYDDTFQWIRTVGQIVQRDHTGKALRAAGYSDNISQQKQGQIAFDRQVKYNEMMRRLSVSLINLPLSDFDDAINASLSQVGSFFGADRAYLFEYNLSAGTANNTFEWCASGIEPQIKTLQDLPIDNNELFEQHKVGKSLLISSVESLEHGKLRDILKRQGISSLLTVPVMQNNRCVGFVGLDAVQDLTIFGTQETELLTVFAELIANLNERKDKEIKLNNSLQQRELLAKHVPGVLYQFRLRPDGSSHFPYASQGIKNIYQVNPEDVVEDATPIFNIIHPDDISNISDSIHLSARELKVWHEQYRIKFKDGKIIWLEGESTPEAMADGSIIWHGYIRDITDRKHLEDSLRLAANVFTFAREGIIITDKDINILEANDAYAELTGYTRKDVIGNKPNILKSGKHDDHFYKEMWQSLEINGYWSGEIINRRKDGGEVVEMLTISTVRDKFNQIQNYIALYSDITTQKKNQALLERIAHFDDLTGLPNRILLADRLRQAMTQTQRRGSKLAVVYIDLDAFKLVNDSHGHDVGNQLLAVISRRMKEVLREGDTLSRLGGDEFVAVLVDLDNQESFLPVIKRLLEVASNSVLIENNILRVTASLGITFYPQNDDVDADQLLRQADQSMYLAKQSGKNRYYIFDAEHDRSVRGRNENLDQIRQGIANGEFELYYQPKVNMQTSEVIGAEALIRWNHPTLGLIYPGKFLPVIEDHPLSIELGEWVIDAALGQIDEWSSQGKNIPVSVNISALQLQQPDFVSRLENLLAKHPKLSSKKLELEILETSALENISSVSQLMTACQEMGVTFALDDFGTGYSSLKYLKQLPANLLKIDQSFVHDMLDDPDDFAILEGILGLADAFRRQVIAEGVETIAHGEMLLRMGCMWAQGYAIARPMPAREFNIWASNWESPPSWSLIKPIGRDRLSILSAIVELRACVLIIPKVSNSVNSRMLRLDPNQSKFGIWLNDLSPKLIKSKKTLREIKEMYFEMHRLALELIERKSESHTIELKEHLIRVENLRDLIIKRLMSLS